jgi:DNA (cytosine-5)-methyltransferase 1
MKEKLNELHLFAGAGGGILGGMLLGHTTVCAVEIEPYCRKVLLQRQRDGILPKFPIWDDVCTFDGKPWRGKVDVVCGGFPCQDISAAGKGAGISEGTRSGLWYQMARIVGEIRPRFVFIENSPLLRKRGLNKVLRSLAEMGYDARWGIVSAENAGAIHKRQRLWIFAYSSSIRLQESNTKFSILSKEIQKSMGLKCGFGDDWTSSGKDWAFRQIQCGNIRSDDGMADWVDRIKAIGNGQVPIVAATAWRILGGE